MMGKMRCDEEEEVVMGSDGDGRMKLCGGP